MCFSNNFGEAIWPLLYVFFCNVVARCLIWVNGILLSFALILCVRLMLSCVIIFKNMSNQFVHMMNFRWSAQGFYPMPCPIASRPRMLFYEQESKEVGNTSRTKSHGWGAFQDRCSFMKKKKKSATPAAPKAMEAMKWRKAAAPTAPKAMADVLFRTDIGKCKSVQLDHELCFAILCTFMYIVTFLCYFHNIVASANRSSYLSIEARDELKHLVAGSLRSFPPDSWSWTVLSGKANDNRGEILIKPSSSWFTPKFPWG